MTAKPVTIHFITWPDGKLFERTQTSISERHAIAAAVHSWLIPQWFPGLDLVNLYFLRSELWAAMQRAGFKLHSLEVPTDVAEGVSL